MEPKEIAPRFSLVLPMKYRPVGHLQWRKGCTVNVSASGLKFTAHEPLESGRMLEVEVSMTASLLKPSRVVALSRVVNQDSSTPQLITTVQHSSCHVLEGDLD